MYQHLSNLYNLSIPNHARPHPQSPTHYSKAWQMTVPSRLAMTLIASNVVLPILLIDADILLLLPPTPRHSCCFVADNFVSCPQHKHASTNGITGTGKGTEELRQVRVSGRRRGVSAEERPVVLPDRVHDCVSPTVSVPSMRGCRV